MHVNNIKMQDTHELPVSSQSDFPADPFPNKYVHCVMDNLQYIVQAVYTLRSAGYNTGDIHVMTCWDFVEAAERRSRQQSRLSRMLMRFLSSIDDGFGDAYLHEAYKGHHILMVYLPNSRQIGRVHAILTAYYAYLIKYVDTCVVTDLSPAAYPAV
jgi:hypothetical protein